VNRRALLRRLLQGAVHNVSFADLVSLVEGLGFELQRTGGSHHLYSHPGVTERLNLQEEHGEAKPYQIRQLLSLIERYNLRVED
jgi:predicted RNA binding protein YcfA (HicA-like mRNA interferase family)